MIEIVVHDHALKHGLTEEDVLYAWNNFVRKQRRKVPWEDEYLLLASIAICVRCKWLDVTEGIG